MYLVSFVTDALPQDVFLARMKHVDANRNRSWEIRHTFSKAFYTVESYRK